MVLRILVLVTRLYTKISNAYASVYAFPWMRSKSTTTFLLIKSYFTCRPYHDLGPIFYLSTDARSQVHNSTHKAMRVDICGSNDSRLHVGDPPRGRSFIWQIGVNLFIHDRRQVDRVFLWSRVSCTRQR